MSTEFHNLPYRPCVGITLINNQKEIFVGERIDHPESWQMPQGGIDDGETIEDAFFREMREEIGTDKAEIIKAHEEPFRYDIPRHLIRKLWNGKYRGQEQFWVAARFTGTDNDIDIYAHNPPEFQRWRWIHADELLDSIVRFKRATYEDVFSAFKDVLDAI